MLKIEEIPGISIETSTEEKKEVVCNLTVELK
jgi:hypothetical protein